MIGINLLDFEEMLKKAENKLNDFADVSKEMNLILNEMSDCYEGKILDDILSTFTEQDNRFILILHTLENYVQYLQKIRMMYVHQDVLFAQNINKI